MRRKSMIHLSASSVLMAFVCKLWWPAEELCWAQKPLTTWAPSQQEGPVAGICSPTFPTRTDCVSFKGDELWWGHCFGRVLSDSGVKWYSWIPLLGEDRAEGSMSSHVQGNMSAHNSSEAPASNSCSLQTSEPWVHSAFYFVPIWTNCNLIYSCSASEGAHLTRRSWACQVPEKKWNVSTPSGISS